MYTGRCLAIRYRIRVNACDMANDSRPGRQHCTKWAVPNTFTGDYYLLLYFIWYSFVPNGNAMRSALHCVTRVARVPTTWLKCQQSCIHERERERGEAIGMIHEEENQNKNSETLKGHREHYLSIERTTVGIDTDHRRICMINSNWVSINHTLVIWLKRFSCSFISLRSRPLDPRINQSHICSIFIDTSSAIGNEPTHNYLFSVESERVGDNAISMNAIEALIVKLVMGLSLKSHM